MYKSLTQEVGQLSSGLQWNSENFNIAWLNLQPPNFSLGNESHKSPPDSAKEYPKKLSNQLIPKQISVYPWTSPTQAHLLKILYAKILINGFNL